MGRDNFHTHGVEIGIRAVTALSEWDSWLPESSLCQLQSRNSNAKNTIFTVGNRCFNTPNPVFACQNWIPNFVALNKSGELAKALELPC